MRRSKGGNAGKFIGRASSSSRFVRDILAFHLTDARNRVETVA